MLSRKVLKKLVTSDSSRLIMFDMNPRTHATLTAIAKAADNTTEKLQPLLGSANKQTAELAAALQSVGQSIARISDDLAKALQAASSKARSKAA